MTNEKPYGHAGEWERRETRGYYECYCGCKGESPVAWVHNEHGWLIDSCFKRLVPTAPAETNDDLYVSGKYLPEGDCYFDGPVNFKRPIDPAEVDETWVGATVECVSNSRGGSYKIGEVFKIREKHSDWIYCFMEGKELAFYIGDFTLVKKAHGTQWDECKSNMADGFKHAAEQIRKLHEEQPMVMGENAAKALYAPINLDEKWRPRKPGEVKQEIEETFDRLRKKADERPPLSGSFTMEVEASSEARESLQALYEESQKRQQTRTEVSHSAELEFPNGDRVAIPPPPESEGWVAKVLWDEAEWPHRYASSRSDLYPIGYQPDMDSHKNGFLIWQEYKTRIITERPRIISLTEWTRTVSENTMGRINQYREQLEYHKTEVAKRIVDSTWPQRHPSGAVKYSEE